MPGANCYGAIRGLFGGASERIVTAGSRVMPLDQGHGQEAVLLALAATARHALAARGAELPDLIVGHGVLGRLLARLALAAGGKAPTVWELDPARRDGAPYPVLHPAEDPCTSYRCIYDVSGDPSGIDRLVSHLAPGGEIVLAGFYPDPVAFAFPPAFMKEARIRIAAEWQPADLAATRALVEEGFLSLDDLLTHCRPAREAPDAYAQAFDDPGCLKMILDWRAQ